MRGENEANGSALDDLRRLEQVVTDLRAETGVEASELRAHVRELERRLEQLESSAPGPPESSVRSPQADNGEGAAPKSAKAQRAAEKRRVRAARPARERPL